MLEIEPQSLGTLEIDGMWVPYVDLYDLDFLPTRITLANAEYAFESSAPTLGHGAVLPQRIREARAGGKKSIIVEREDRYYLFLTPP